TNAVRLRLSVGRVDARTIGPEYAQADDQFAPLPPQALRGDPDIEAFAALDFRPLRSAARQRFLRTLAPGGPLRTSAAGIRSIDESRANQLETRFDKDRGLKLLGEAYSFLNFPDDLARGVAAPVRLFHVPFGFLPLGQHPVLGDPQTTFEFAEYLVNLLA